jgi:hypothetical protein
MPASYPNSVKVFTTKTTGQTILASHINEPQDEITAIEQGLLQGLAHALFPNTDAGQDLGTTTKRWRNLLVQKIASGITNATKLRIQEVGTSTWITVNADFDGTNWNREDTTQPAQGIEINNNKEVKYYRAAAGDNPITWTNIFTISTDKITASQAVIGTDPGGTEVLRAQNLRAGTTIITGDLTATTAVIGTDPGGTESLRAQNLRAGPTTITGALSTTDTISAPTAVIGTDPGGTEVLRAQNIRAGATTLTATLTAPSAVIGTDPGGTEVLRAQGLRAGGGIFSDIYSNTVVAGTDPGGTESLRAGSARLNAPVLLGSVPQFTMSENPTEDLQVATKQYVDNKLLGGFTHVVVFTTTGSQSWEVPTGVDKIHIKCWGAGGGGGGARGSGTGGVAIGGGGGGGGYAEAIVTVNPGETLTVTVGAGGAGGNAPSSDNEVTAGGSGEASSVARGTTVLVKANGGGGAGSVSGTGQATGGSGGDGVTGDITAQGGNGSNSIVAGLFSISTSIGGGAAFGGGAATLYAISPLVLADIQD